MSVSFFVELYLGWAFQNYAPEDPLALGASRIMHYVPCDCRLTRSTLDLICCKCLNRQHEQINLKWASLQMMWVMAVTPNWGQHKS
jgi:hypothetical protein